MFKQRDLDKLERRFGHLAIPQLMQILVVGMAIIYVLDIFNRSALSMSSFLAFDRAAIFSGQIWRIFTFIFLPPAASPLFILITLYFYWIIGQSLERIWGSFRFTLYYFCGYIGALLAGFITGYTSNYYLNLSLFLAFAIHFPDLEVLLFFILPVKMKYLGAFSAAYLLYLFIVSSWSGKLAILMSLLNVVLFFGPDLVDRVKGLYRRYKWRRDTED